MLRQFDFLRALSPICDVVSFVFFRCLPDYRFNKWMPPFEVVRSISGPPFPITPSRRLRLSSPCARTSNSVSMDELEVRAETRALVPAARRSVMGAFLVSIWTLAEKLGGKVKSTPLLEVSIRTGLSALAMSAFTPLFEVFASSDPSTRSARIWPLEVWARTLPPTPCSLSLEP